MRQCREDNRRAHAEVMQLFQQARASGNIDRREAHQFQAMEARLDRHRDMLRRDGLTLAECQHLSREIANERATVQQMAASPNQHAQVRQCREDNRRAHAEVMQLFQQARASGNIDRREAHQFQAMEARLNRHRDMLRRDGLTLAECQHLSRELANERAAVQQMAASPNQHAQVRQCREDNRRVHGEIMQQFQQARAAGRIDPSEQQQFNAMEARLHNHRNMLARDGLTLAECQHIGRELANERAHVQRMAASPAHDPRVRQCRQDNQRAHGEVWQLFQQARAAGRISPAEQQQFSAMEARLNNHRNMLARDGLTLAECQHISREIANERAAVQRMAASHSQVRQCRQDNQRAHGEVWQLFQQARAAGRISPSEQQQFSAMEARLNNHRNMLARDGLTLAECQHISREIANERAAVQRMAASHSQVRQCRQDNQRVHGEVWQQFQRARSAGRISPAEQQQFSAMEARLNNHRNMLARDGLTLAECQHLGREIARERTEVQRMAATRR
ncbi:hypothetical protein [Formivibrio citricus]|uniref:hypothetical protein n=1 Tax=Formivibrio citricus TaxID=83765 RepID=UPI0011601A89|nr:hypothetical protein [Formivibrio citricus]